MSEFELPRLIREVDRTRSEYLAAVGEERKQCWKLYQRALANYNAALDRENKTFAKQQ
jgi:hypothetical protein